MSCVGQIRVNAQTFENQIWDGSRWIPISECLDPTIFKETHGAYRVVGPNKFELEAHPALKSTWEEYVMVRKLLGI